MSPSVLYVFTSAYPYSGAQEEPFLAPELRALSEVFERIVLVPEGNAGRRLPTPGIECDESYLGAAAVVSRGQLLHFGLATRALRHELRRRPQLLLDRARLQRLLSVVARAERTRRWVLAKVRNERGPARRVFYTYWLDQAAVGLGLARGVGITVSRAHGYDVYEERQDPAYLPCRPLLFDELTRVFFVSEHGRSYAAARYPQATERLEVSRLGVGPAPAPARPSTDGRVRMLSCSAVVPVKRIPLLAECLCALARSDPDTEFEWSHLGDGPDRENVARVLQDGKPANLRVVMTGPMEHAAVLGFYDSSPVDLFVNVSSSEGIAVAAMEAQSRGVPVLATDVGGMSELVVPEAGALVGADATAEEVAAALRGLLRRDQGALRSASLANWAARYDGRVNYRDFARRLRALLPESGERL